MNTNTNTNTMKYVIQSQSLKYYVLFRTHTLYINLQAQYILYFVCSHHHFNVQSFKFKCCCCPCGPDILTVAPLVRVKALYPDN